MPQKYNKEWYDKNKDRMKAYRDEYQKKNADKVKEYRKRDYEKRKARMAADPEYRAHVETTCAKYRKAHPEVLKKAGRKYSEKVKNLSTEEREEYLARKREIARRNYAKHVDKYRQKSKEHRDACKDLINAKRRQKYAQDPNYNRSKSRRDRRDALANQPKTSGG